MKEFIIYDTEFTCWEGSLERNWSDENEYKEIIQVSAIKVNEKLEIIDKINILVKPILNPIISEYCIKLTGLSVKEIIEADTYASMLKQYEEFNYNGSIKSWSWGNDINVMIENNNINKVKIGNISSFNNLQLVFKNENIDYGTACSGELAAHFGIKLDGHVHNAEFDTFSLFKSIEHFEDQVLNYLF